MLLPASLLADGVALSLFWAILMDILNDDVCAKFVAMSARAFPPPWVLYHMPMKRGSLWVPFSMVIHEGGGLPLIVQPGSHCIMGCCGLWAHKMSYATTHPITPPLWAHISIVSCGVL